MGIPVVISTNGCGLPVKAVSGNAPVMTVATNGYGMPIVLSDLGVPFIIQGGGVVPIVPPYVAPTSYEWAFVTENGIRVVESSNRTIALKRAA